MRPRAYCRPATREPYARLVPSRALADVCERISRAGVRGLNERNTVVCEGMIAPTGSPSG